MTAGHCTDSGRGITRRDLGRVTLASVLAASSSRAAAAMPSAPRAVVPEPAWRADFPALQQVVNGQPLAYLDSAATTQRLAPCHAGSNMAHQIDFSSQELEHGARKFGAGTPNVSGAVGLAVAVAYLRGLDRAAIEQHEAHLTQHTLDLAALPLLKHFGVSETARASCYLYTNTSQLDRLAAALRELAA